MCLSLLYVTLCEVDALILPNLDCAMTVSLILFLIEVVIGGVHEDEFFFFLQKTLNMIHKNNHEYMTMLFYAS